MDVILFHNLKRSHATLATANETYLFPNRSFATELLARCFLWFGLVDFDHAAVELGLVHVVDGFEGVLGEGEFDVAEASVRVLGGFSF